VEIERITVDAGGGATSLEAGPMNLTFGLAEWKRVVEAGGDLAVLGVRLKPDDKVAHFDENWRGM
jgi:hypothetical protein